MFSGRVSSAQDISSNLRGDWRLVETSGTTAVDSSSLANNGTYQNGVVLAGSTAVPTDGAIAAVFDGSNDYVSVPNESNYDITGVITVAAWIKVTAFDKNWQSIITKGSTGGWRLSRNNNTNNIQFSCAGLTTTAVNSTKSVNDGQWHQVVGVYDGSALRLYIDGNLDATANSTGSITTNNIALNIGKNAATANREWHGAIYDARVYNRALSATDVAYLFVAGLPIGHWRLNETAGTTAADSSVFKKNGTVTGGASWSTRCSGTGTFDFNGTSQYVSIPNSPLYQLRSALTITGWVRGDSWGSGTTVNTILRKGDANPNNWQLCIGDGRASLALDDNDPPAIKGNTVLSTGQWYHVAATWDGATAKIYVNGQLDMTPVAKSGTIGSDARPLYIGGQSGATDFFDGMIYDVRLYNRALSQSEINEIYGLDGNWKLSETSGTTAADSTVFAKNGTLNGTAHWSTRCGGVNTFDFDGSTNYFSVTNGSNLQPTTEVTLAGWIKGDAWGSGSDVDTILRKGDTNPNNYQLAIADGRVALYLDDSDSGGIRGNTVLLPNEWYHVAATWNGATARIYVNGVLDNTPAARTGTINKDTRPLYIGGQPSGDKFDGMMYDLRIYSRALCPTEIAELSGLIGQWKLDETVGTTAYDSSGLADNGTYQNGVALAASTSVPGYGAIAAVFDGNNDYVSVPNESNFEVTGSISVAVWIKVSSFTKTWQAIFTKGDSAWRLSRNGTGNTIHFACTGLSQFQVNGAVDVNDGRWHHLAGVYDGSALSLYVDGVLDASVSSTGSISANNYNVEIGRNAEQSGREFDGAIYDARVYRRALCPAEIQGLFNGNGVRGVRIIKWVELQ